MFWRYEELDVRDDVQLGLPDDWKLRVFKVTSGDSGKMYHVQVIATPKSKPIYLCQCPSGYFRLPLSILGAGECCKHATNLAVYLKSEEK